MDMYLLFTTRNLLDSCKIDRGSREPLLKHYAVVDYNINMRLVDKSDMQISSINCLRKCCKWYMKAFLLNAFIMYKQVTG